MNLQSSRKTVSRSRLSSLQSARPIRTTWQRHTHGQPMANRACKLQSASHITVKYYWWMSRRSRANDASQNGANAMMYIGLYIYIHIYILLAFQQFSSSPERLTIRLHTSRFTAVWSSVAAVRPALCGSANWNPTEPVWVEKHSDFLCLHHPHHHHHHPQLSSGHVTQASARASLAVPKCHVGRRWNC